MGPFLSKGLIQKEQILSIKSCSPLRRDAELLPTDCTLSVSIYINVPNRMKEDKSMHTFNVTTLAGMKLYNEEFWVWQYSTRKEN